jgi:hypothetical protein
LRRRRSGSPGPRKRIGTDSNSRRQATAFTGRKSMKTCRSTACSASSMRPRPGQLPPRPTGLVPSSTGAAPHEDTSSLSVHLCALPQAGAIRWLNRGVRSMALSVWREHTCRPAVLQPGHAVHSSEPRDLGLGVEGLKTWTTDKWRGTGGDRWKLGHDLGRGAARSRPCGTKSSPASSPLCLLAGSPVPAQLALDGPDRQLRRK